MPPTPLRIDVSLPEYRFRMGLHFPYTYINRGRAFFARFFSDFLGRVPGFGGVFSDFLGRVPGFGGVFLRGM